MGREIRYRNYGVYVPREVGQRHHLPHAHIKNRGRLVASVFLLTLTFYDVVERLPRELVDLIKADQERLLEVWEELNDG
jgi:hypothetical protein